MILTEMIDKVALYCDSKRGEPYFVEKVKDGINAAYKKIAKEKFNLTVSELNNDDDTVDLTISKYVDDRTYCYFAAYQYLLIEDEGKAFDWLDRYNDDYENIKVKDTDYNYDTLKQTQIENSYDIF